jgi:hypothetical protein
MVMLPKAATASEGMPSNPISKPLIDAMLLPHAFYGERFGAALWF